MAGYYPGSVQEGAGVLAQNYSPRNLEAQNQYRQELLQLYDVVRDKDFAVVYNTGGFGGTTMEVDKDWGSVVRGIQEILQNMGFSAAIIEHQRSEYGFRGVVGESIELVRGYPNKARELSAKLDFLMHYETGLKVIVTGRSHGAVFGNEVMRLMTAQPGAYAILAGTPFWYHKSPAERSLVINHNGVEPDTLHNGDFCAILIANRRGLLAESPPGGAVQILKWYIRVPGHEYTWQYREVRAEIEDFLRQM